MNNLEGQTFAGYEIVAKLGQGGMGAVYKARQPMLSRLVALKVMAPHLGADPSYVARFIREAASAAKLNHPNMVRVYTAGEADGIHFIEMEFVEGESLQKRLHHLGRIEPREAIAITVYVAQALQYAWNKAHLIHRDIKPDNIFLSNSGEVKVGDLGLAKSVGAETTELTQTGTAMGSPHYISPEQAQAVKDMDFRTDIYSLGCTLYHMLSGQTPYSGDSAMIVMMKHVHDPPPAIFKVWPACPMPLGMLVGKMLAKDRNARPQSYEQLIAELLTVNEKLPQGAVPAPAPQQASATSTPAGSKAVASLPVAAIGAQGTSAKSKNQRAIYVAVGVVAVVALAGLLLWSPWKAGEGASGRRQVETGSESRLQAEGVSGQSAKAETPNAISTSAALKLLGNVFTNAVGAEMVNIPPGEFMMGSTKEEQAWAMANKMSEENVKPEGEAPRKTTIKQGFWMGRTEVTVGQWRQFVSATGYVTDGEKKGEASSPQGVNKPWAKMKGMSWKDPKFFALEDNQAVTFMSWNDAVAFCEWLTERERKAGRLPENYKVRLPTEAEWEYACRAGTQTKFWWGESSEDGKGRLNWLGKEDGYELVAPVDSYGARGRNGFGLADMLGNQWEWCLDGYDATQAHEECYQGNPDARVLRGGSSRDGPANCRCAPRHGRPPAPSTGNHGFRVAVGVDVLGSAASAAPVSEEVATPPPAEWKNLIPGIDPKRDGIAGDWKVENGRLLCTASTRQGNSFCEVPVDYKGGNYDLRFRVTRAGGGAGISGISFLFRKGTTGGQVWFDFWTPTASARGVKFAGLSMVKGKQLTGNETRRERPSWLPIGQEKTVLLQVRDEGIVVSLDGEEVFRWEGNWEDVTQGGARSTNPVFCVSSPTRCEAVFSAIEMREVTGKSTLPRAAPSAQSNTPALQHSNVSPPDNAVIKKVAAMPPAEWKNLIPGIDPKRDGISGDWKVENGRLLCTTRTGWPLCEVPVDYKGGNYDIRFRVTRGTGSNAGVFFLFRKGSTGGEVVFDHTSRKGVGVRVAGFSSVKSKGLVGNETNRERFSSWLPKGQEKTVLLQVRDEGIVVSLDGEEVFRWEGNWEDVTQRSGVISNNKITRPIFGVCPWCCEAVFNAIEMREVSDKGMPTRAEPSAPSNTPALQHSNVSPTDDVFVKEVAALPAEQQVVRVMAKLKELNPGFDGQETHKIEGKDVVELSFASTSISDILPIKALSKLQKLHCVGKAQSGMLADLSPLRGMQLVELRCGGNPIGDFSPLKGMPLNVLWCPTTKLADLSVFKGLPLTELGFAHTEVSDLSPLQGMSLTTLWAGAPNIKDISPLKGMLSLQRLFINGTQVADLTPLKGSRLNTLNCQNTPVSDLSPLKDTPLNDLKCNFVASRDTTILRSIPTLKMINGMSAEEFWKRVDAGASPQPKRPRQKG
ncbi:MAG: bifunctional serine/threonine-protein kinase/formylglycine-generating enzyme family protein [Verrucomicrobia bacterium]|nr:bifunctional serine/threonine-protein kinase/formylglycine-generating enzyme family protein [Verrucomicrobiota bacterium]